MTATVSPWTDIPPGPDRLGAADPDANRVRPAALK